MLLIYGVLCLCVFTVLISFATLICRNPRTPEWINNGIAFIALPFLIGLLASGVAIMVNFVMALNSGSINTGLINIAEDLTELGVCAAMVVVTIVAVKALGIKKRLAAYEQMNTSARVIELNGTGPSTTPPQQPRPVKQAA
jgi:hypothetical protein